MQEGREGCFLHIVWSKGGYCVVVFGNVLHTERWQR